MRPRSAAISALFLSACVSNTITLDSGDGSDDMVEATEGVTPTPATTTPPSTSTTTPTTTSTTTTTTTTAGPTSVVTTNDPGDTTFDPGNCDPPCAPDQECIAGVCFDDPPDTEGACNAAQGWGPCDPRAQTCLEPNELCVVDATPMAENVLCSVTPCDDSCDCPLAPATGNAVVACEPILGNGESSCILDCSGGRTCPDGMTCFAGFVCMHPVP